MEHTVSKRIKNFSKKSTCSPRSCGTRDRGWGTGGGLELSTNLPVARHLPTGTACLTQRRYSMRLPERNIAGLPQRNAVCLPQRNTVCLPQRNAVCLPQSCLPQRNPACLPQSNTVRSAQIAECLIWNKLGSVFIRVHISWI